MFASQVYNPGVYGEKDFKNYSGHDWPIFEIDSFSNKIIWNDEKVEKGYVNYLTGGNTKELENFFENQLYQAINCPHEQISKNYQLLRFMNRLLAISYLFESLREFESTSMKIGLNIKECQINWEETFKKCNPQSKFMKYFLKNLPVTLKQFTRTLVSSDLSKKKYRSDWLDKFSKMNFENVTHYRMDSYCKENNCSSRKAIDLPTSFRKVCRKDISQIINICSEKDFLYGMYKISEAYQILSNSTILNVINQQGNAKGCLRRFAVQMKSKELHSNTLQAIFPILYSTFSSDATQIYKEGKIFAAGQLVEFLDKGLENVFEKDKDIVAEVKKVEIPKINTKPVSKIKVAKIKEVKKVEKKVVATLKKEEVKSPWKSSFLVAAEFRKKYDLQLSKVDMLKFKYDYFFSLKISKVMDRALESYMELKALREMKQYDNLGSANGPVPLIFIKYMIDQGHHQGLFNLINALGDRFYVKNNIDPELGFEKDYIELRNDKTTSFQWQIFIRKTPQT